MKILTFHQVKCQVNSVGMMVTVGMVIFSIGMVPVYVPLLIRMGASRWSLGGGPFARVATRMTPMSGIPV